MFVWPVFLSAALLLTISEDVGVLCESTTQNLIASTDLFSKEKELETSKRFLQGKGKSLYKPIYCSFNFDLCGFEDYKNTATRVQVHRMTHSAQQGKPPILDRTWGNGVIGSYMGVEYTSLRNFNGLYDQGSKSSVATIKSPFFGPADNYCLKFWYILGRKDPITIDVTSEVEDGVGYSVLNFDESTHHQWKLAQYDFDKEYAASGLKFVFRFNIPRRRPRHVPVPYAAIDDFYVYNTSCSNLPTRPATGYSFNNENSTSYYTFHPELKNWTSAYITCRKEGPMSFLVSVESREEQNYLVQKIKKNAALTRASKKGGIYTSGNDINNEKIFRWSGTLDNKAFDYTNWKAGQPNNVKGNQDCVALQYHTPNNYAWGDEDCATPLPFICEVNIPKLEDPNLG